MRFEGGLPVVTRKGDDLFKYEIQATPRNTPFYRESTIVVIISNIFLGINFIALSIQVSGEDKVISGMAMIYGIMTLFFTPFEWRDKRRGRRGLGVIIGHVFIHLGVGTFLTLAFSYWWLLVIAAEVVACIILIVISRHIRKGNID